MALLFGFIVPFVIVMAILLPLYGRKDRQKPPK